MQTHAMIIGRRCLVPFLWIAFSSCATAGGLIGDGWQLYAEHTNATLTATGGVLRIVVNRPSEPFYLTQVNQTLATPLPAGHRIRLSFEARATGGNPVRALLERNGEPYTAVAEINPTLGAGWKTYRGMDVTLCNWPAGSLGVRFQVGHRAGTIELRNIQLVDEGIDARAAAAAAALTPDKIEERIRQHRMAGLQIAVRDAAGRPVPGAGVRIEQRRHAFLFGCNIFELKPDDESAAQKAYQEKFAALLNYATLPFYWGSFERERGKPQYERLEKMARWCRAQGIACKGHPLVWHEAWPAWAPAEADEAIPLLRARVGAIIPRYRDTIRYWDVFNEANSATAHLRTGVGQWIRRDGPVAAVAAALGWAREANRESGATLLYNDYNTGAENEKLLRGLRDRDALPDAVGIQSHMHGGTWPLTRAWDVAERFAAFDRPVHFTELTVVSGPEPKHASGQEPVPGWNTTPAGEAGQARYVPQLYTVWFSHPAVRAITWWDFSDRGAWKGAPAGLLRKDMSSKPVYDELYKLIREKWWTRAVTTTDATGTAHVRVFRGAHTVTVTGAAGRQLAQEIEIPADCAATNVTLTLPVQ